MIWIMVALATVLTAFWLIQLTRITQDDWVAAAYAQVVDNRIEVRRMQQDDEERAKRLEQYHGVSYRVMRLILGGGSEKKIGKMEQQSEDLQAGDLHSLSLLMMPGFVLQRKVEAIGHGTAYKTILGHFTELYGRKYAPNKTKQMMAKLVSYPIIAAGGAFWAGAMFITVYGRTYGLSLTGVLLLVVGVLTYAMYDEAGDRVKKRRKAISRQFPNVVSKLALLVTSGMIMDRAWNETAQSQNGELYQEMQLTARELTNLVEPTAAYTNFINRCNTKETTKLASAIIQNLSKGNAEIGDLLRSMSHEAWQERRHMAKRDSEAANSKLMIPTMLLFVSILIMIMVPVAMSFANL